MFYFTCYCLKMASKTVNNSKFTKELEIFTNWTVDGAQYTYHENMLWYQNFSNLRISKPPSNEFNLHISISQR